LLPLTSVTLPVLLGPPPQTMVGVEVPLLPAGWHGKASRRHG
jgi:hypothetical protein